MSHSEEDLLVQEVEAKKQKVCILSKQGITLFGYHASWIVVALVVVAVYFYLKKQGMLGDSVGDVFSGPAQTFEQAPAFVPAPADIGAQAAVNAMAGGFKKMNFLKPGEVRRMFNQ